MENAGGRGCGAAGLPLIAVAGACGEGRALRPDRSFDTLACGAAPGAPDGLCATLASLAGGACCALLEPRAAAVLAGAHAPGGGVRGTVEGKGPGRPSGLPGVEVRATLAMGGDGRVAVESLRAWLAQGRDGDVLRVVLNGAAGPYLCRPLQMGADAVVEDLRMSVPPALLSAAGLGDGSTGSPCLAAVCRSEGAWEALEARLAAAVDGGPVARGLGPAVDALLAEALATLSLRAQRRSDTALVAAHYLAAHAGVAWVSYPGLPDDPANDAARRSLEHGFGPLVAFGPAAGKEVALPPAPAGMWQAGCDRSTLAAGSLPGSYVLAAGLESPLDVVGALERMLAGPAPLPSCGKSGAEG